jgi:hypothetical protein
MKETIKDRLYMHSDSMNLTDKIPSDARHGLSSPARPETANSFVYKSNATAFSLVSRALEFTGVLTCHQSDGVCSLKPHSSDLPSTKSCREEGGRNSSTERLTRNTFRACQPLRIYQGWMLEKRSHKVEAPKTDQVPKTNRTCGRF